MVGDNLFNYWKHCHLSLLKYFPHTTIFVQAMYPRIRTICDAINFLKLNHLNWELLEVNDNFISISILCYKQWLYIRLFVSWLQLIITTFFYSHPKNTTIEYGSIKRWGCCWEEKGFYIHVQHLKQGSYGSPKYLNGYVPPNGVVSLGTRFRDVS